VHPDNGIFASADAAYVVAYSIIMLTTDLHNAQASFIFVVICCLYAFFLLEPLVLLIG
jgi:hypothetical protein